MSSVSLYFLIKNINFEAEIFLKGEDCNICELKMNKYEVVKKLVKANE